MPASAHQSKEPCGTRYKMVVELHCSDSGKVNTRFKHRCAQVKEETSGIGIPMQTKEHTARTMTNLACIDYADLTLIGNGRTQLGVC